MASMAKWEQRAKEALMAGRLAEYRSMKGKIGADSRRRLEAQFLREEPVKAAPKPAPAPKPVAAKVTKKAAPKKTAPRRASAKKRAAKSSE